MNTVPTSTGGSNAAAPRTARTSPPAKLNLFLEIPAKRDDGYHEIDTTMVAIDWRDELEVQLSLEPNVELTVDWLPSVGAVAQQLGLAESSTTTPELLRVPTDDSNLVVQALTRFRERFNLQTGFRVHLGKRIPSGAGMGGASSDAAHALLCAVHLHQLTQSSEAIYELAAEVGSDVPFFLADSTADSLVGVRARGRGELLDPVFRRTPLHFVVAYPSHSLSTASVYRQLRVPEDPVDASHFLKTFQSEQIDQLTNVMMNRLTEPALEIMPTLSDLLKSLEQSGLQPCQLTGSGSACFGVAIDSDEARTVVEQLRSELQPGALVQAVQMVSPVSPVVIQSG
ncbi:MAG: 4-(cytidine 5'-diphospho)-2-C-methyl-D-erythritol kinase [Planctomycetota bacterium]